MPSQPMNLFNSQYQLTNSNPSRVFSQNIAYIQPNSVSSFQPNIVVFPLDNVEFKKKNQSLVNNQNLSLPIDNITLKSENQTVNSAVNRPVESVNGTPSNSQLFEISQIGENPTEIEAESVQNHESLDSIPVSPLNNNLNESNSSLVVNNPISNDSPINNATESLSTYSNNSPVNSLTMISNSSTDQTEKQLDSEPIIDLNNSYVLNDNALRSRSIRQFNPIFNNNQIRSKPLNATRSHRSLVVDMPSVASYLTAAVAQSGHSNEERSIMYTRFLNNYN